MQPGGVERLPQWVQGSAALLVLALILVGGLWLQMKEKKDREIERQRLKARSPEGNDTP
jgi:hypothetical protein